MNLIFQHTIHIAGTLTANVNNRFAVPYDCTLLHVSAVSSNANPASLTIGSPTDADAYLAANDTGENGTPLEFQRASFVNGEFPRISKGATVVVAATHNSSANVTIILTLAAG